MIGEWTKVFVVDKGSILETPKVRIGFVSAVLSSSEYVVTLDDGNEKLYQAEDVFLSCRSANECQMAILGKRMNFLRPRLTRMENTLLSMTG